MSSVIIYGADWCGDCVSTKYWLNKHNIAYTYSNVDETGREEIEKIAPGNRSIPVVAIDEKTVLIEPSYKELNDAILS